MRIKDLDAAERPREKLIARGPAALSDGELLAVLLRGGTPSRSSLELARDMLSEADGRLSVLFNMSAQKLQKMPGIGPCKAAEIQATFELGRRFLQEEAGPGTVPIVSPRMVYNRMIPVLKGLDHEECWVIFLNARNCEISRTRVSSGGGLSTTIDVPQIIRTALERGASGIFLVHNHPTGSPMPSRADIAETERLRNGMRTVGLSLLDHVIVSDSSFFSFAEERSLPA